MSQMKLFLPVGYRTQEDVVYFDDSFSLLNETVFQPEIYPLAEYLLLGTGRTRLVDVGCGIGRKLAEARAAAKLGIDFGANIARCRAAYPDAADWRELDLGEPVPPHILEDIGPMDVVVCSDVVEHIPDPRPLLHFLRDCFRRGALVITSTPDRVLVRGAAHLGPPPNRSHVREWAIAEYGALLQTNDLPPLYLGLTHNNDRDRLLRTIVSLHEPRLQSKYKAASTRPLAILSCFNEADVIDEVIEHWIAQGCDVHVLDNWSTDRSWPILQDGAARFHGHMIAERFPAEEPSRSSWRDILARKEEIAFGHNGRWIIHTDADEIRLSPFAPFNLADAMHLVALAGWNRINFTVLNHRPTDERPYLPGALASALPHFEFGTKPGHFLQKKAWIQGDEKTCLTETGGHAAEFAGANDCPYHFVLHHYPLRSIEHGWRKVNLERNGRWSAQEQVMGWHSHYGDLAGKTQLIWDAVGLHDATEDFWVRHGLQILSGLQR